MIRLGLNSIGALCDKLNNPQDKLRFIHVAGTNGKGSTSQFIASILRDASIKTGVYSSPAVFSDEEIIRVNNRAISKADYARLNNIVEDASRMMEEEGNEAPTEFEIETAIAFLYFVEKDCDIVVIECGMGGESDATNIIKNSLACVFTPISMDHMDYLGNSLHKIATVKAGIIKKGSKVFTVNTDKDVISALNAKALECDTEVDIIVENKKLSKYIDMKAAYQVMNASLAEAVVHGISPINLDDGRIISITDKNITNGLHNTKMPGRFEIISTKPLVVIDGAHNEGAAIALKESLKSTFKNKEFVFITGMLVNKDHEAVLSNLLPLAKQVLTVSTKGPRGFLAEELAKVALKYNNNVSAIGGLEEAMDIANLMWDNKSVIVVFGTLTLLKDVKKWISVKQK